MMPYSVVAAVDACDAKSNPHFLQVVRPRFASVPQTGHMRRVGLVMNQMIERIANPINQTQKTAAAPMLLPAVNPASQAPLFVAVSHEDELSATAYATIKMPIAMVNTKTTHDIFRQRRGFTATRSFVDYLTNHSRRIIPHTGAAS